MALKLRVAIKNAKARKSFPETHTRRTNINIGTSCNPNLRAASNCSFKIPPKCVNGTNTTGLAVVSLGKSFHIYSSSVY